MALLAGCGGGSSSADPAATATVTSPVTPTIPIVTTPVVTSTTLGSTLISGVVSTGAPVMGAQVRVIDATGAAVSVLDANGQSVAKTSVADGSYRINLASATQNLPLLVQVSGIDASGLPVVLHSALTTSTLPLVVNVTPATDAILAMVLGAHPRAIWAAAAANVTILQSVGSTSAVTAASDLLKTVIKASLTAGKITDTKTLDFFKDGAFVANKTGLDLALEGLRFQIIKTSAGLDQLQVSNKFVSKATPEVRINLATVRTELNKTTGGLPATAVVSALKAATNPSTVSANLGVLDDLTAKLNQLIAQLSPPSSASTFDTAAPLAGTGTYVYTTYNGRTKGQLTALLAGYAAANWQLGRLLVTGCANDPVPTSGCSRVSVSTLVTDSSGAVKGVFHDVVGYQPAVTAVAATATKPAVAASPAQWRLVGNGLQTQFDIAPATYATYDATGALIISTLAQPNPLSGVIAELRAQDWATPPAAAVSESLVQVPSNFSVRFSDCAHTLLCINLASSTSTPPVIFSGTLSGTLDDVLIRQTSLNWVGSVDTIAGAKYVATFALGATTTPTYTQTAYLGADVPLAVPVTELPMLDALPTRTQLQAAATTKVTLNWSNWATANPHMTMTNIRLISQVGAQAPVITDYPQLNLSADTRLEFKALDTPAATTTYRLLLTSQDNFGRHFYSLVSLPN